MSREWMERTERALERHPEALDVLAWEAQRFVEVRGHAVAPPWRLVRVGGMLAWRYGRVLVRATLGDPDEDGWCRVGVSVSVQVGGVPYRAPDAVLAAVREAFLGPEGRELVAAPTSTGSPVMMFAARAQIPAEPLEVPPQLLH